jgi:hypothetical protein
MPIGRGLKDMFEGMGKLASSKDEAEEKFKEEMARMGAFFAVAQGDKNPIEVYQQIKNYKPPTPPAEAIQSADPAQQMQNFTQRAGQPPQGLPPRQIDPITSAGFKTDPAVDAYRQRKMLMGLEGQEEQAKATIKGEAKKQEAIQKASGNFGRVASAMKQYADYYSGALEEGGAGNLYKREKGKLFTQQIGGGVGEQLTETGKLFGQRAELSLSMVPILTNQNRFMTSIMDYINQSLPQGHEGKKLARGKFEQTLLNQFATTKVLTRLGFDPEIKEDVAKLDGMDDNEAAALAKQVISLSKAYTLSAEEKKEFEAIRDDVLGSLMDGKKKEKSFSNLWSE